MYEPSFPFMTHGLRRPWAGTPRDPLDVERALLREAFALPDAPPALLDRLAAAARRYRCPSGPLDLPSPAEPLPAWWLVASGRLTAVGPAAGGGRREKRSLGPGQWLDTAGALSAPGGWLDGAVCRGVVELMALPVAALCEAAAGDPQFAQALLGVMARAQRALNERLDELASTELPARLARWLLRQAEPLADLKVPVSLRLHQRKQDIARELCTTAESLSRTLRRLSDDGLMAVDGYQVTLLDPHALAHLARAPRRSR